MGNRLDLHDELIDMLGTKGEKLSRVYFQPDISVNMTYPCIRYSLEGINHRRADDTIYSRTNRYEVTVIDPDPDSIIHEKIMEHFPMCVFNRAYVSDNLNHKSLTLYY